MPDGTENQGPGEGEGDQNDLFGFPEVDGLEQFGLDSQTEGGAGLGGNGKAPVDAVAPAPEVPVEVGAARPNPPVPNSVSDLDEDLFGFDEIFSIDDDPFYNGTLTADGQPASPLAEPESVPEGLAMPNALADAAAPVQQSAAPAPATAAAAAPSPAPAAPRENDLLSNTEMNTGAPQPSLMGQPTLARDRGPRILLPEDVPYAPAGDHGKLMWALIVCFLMVNTGIFMLAHQASTNVHTSISEATGLLAQALSQRGAPTTLASAPTALEPAVTHTIERNQPDGTEYRPEPLPVPSEPWVDSRNYSGTHELAVGNAKALLAEGRFEDARRLLNHVLANQARVPLAPSLREEIDYLIPLTYYEHGRSIASEEDQ